MLDVFKCILQSILKLISTIKTIKRSQNICDIAKKILTASKAVIRPIIRREDENIPVCGLPMQLSSFHHAHKSALSVSVIRIKIYWWIKNTMIYVVVTEKGAKGD